MRRKILPYNPILKPLAKKLRQNMTFAEVLLWNEIKQKKIEGYDFDRQRPIGNYIVDFYCKDLQLAIEVDGSSHNSDEAFLKDQKRQSELEQMGVSFLRFDNETVKNDMLNVLRTIETWVLEWESKNNPPLPLPRGD